MLRCCFTFWCLLISVTTSWAEAPKVQKALKGLDPVELCAGRELPGQAQITSTHGLFQYFFSSATNKESFDKSPNKYAVQFGGVCMKMGPLSGQGSPDRFYVHANRIYLFASDSCRNAFKSAPENFVDKADDEIQGTEAEKQHGQVLLNRLIQGFGGKDAVDSVKSFQVKYSLSYPQKDKPPFLMTRLMTSEFPDKYREEDSYTGWSGVAAIQGQKGFQTSRTTAWPIDESIVQFMRRRALRDPLAIARNRHHSEFRAIAKGTGTIGEERIDWLVVSVHGATTKLAINEQGRVVQIQYRDRTSSMIGEVTKTYSDFRNVKGLLLPFQLKILHNSKPVSNPETTIESIQVNAPVNESMFEIPQ